MLSSIHRRLQLAFSIPESPLRVSVFQVLILTTSFLMDAGLLCLNQHEGYKSGHVTPLLRTLLHKVKLKLLCGRLKSPPSWGLCFPSPSLSLSSAPVFRAPNPHPVLPGELLGSSQAHRSNAGPLALILQASSNALFRPSLPHCAGCCPALTQGGRSYPPPFHRGGN